MKKVLIFCLSAALLLVSLTACHKPQADQPTEPDPPQTVTTTQADVSTPEPLTSPESEPPEQAPAHPDQLSDTTPADLDKTDASQPPEETTPSETPKEPPEQSPKTAVPQTTPPTSQPGSSYGDDLTPEQYAEIERQMWEAFEQGGGTIAEGRTEELIPEEEEYIGTILNGGTTQPQQPQQSSTSQQNKDGWNQAFYETLTPEQKTVYENMTSASERNMMKQSMENMRQREAEGWIVDGSDPTEEELKEAWGNITFGQ